MIPSPSPRAHSSVRMMHHLLTVQGRSRNWLSRRSGVAKSTFWRWWTGAAVPNGYQIDDCLQALGYKIDYRRAE